MGRKRNVRFLFVSQNVDDIASSAAGSPATAAAGGAAAAAPVAGRIVDNMETKVLMNMDDEAADGAARVLGLSPQEAARIKSFEPGNALLLTKKHRLHVRLEPSEQEACLFDTTPPPPPASGPDGGGSGGRKGNAAAGGG